MLYEALAFRVISVPIRDKPDPHVQLEVGFSPVELDEMELWQIAVLLDKHKIEKPMGAGPPADYEERAAHYQRSLEERKKTRRR